MFVLRLKFYFFSVIPLVPHQPPRRRRLTSTRGSRGVSGEKKKVKMQIFHAPRLSMVKQRSFRSFLPLSWSEGLSGKERKVSSVFLAHSLSLSSPTAGFAQPDDAPRGSAPLPSARLRRGCGNFLKISTNPPYQGEGVEEARK
jgi:hypothetical protein